MIQIVERQSFNYSQIVNEMLQLQASNELKDVQIKELKLKLGQASESNLSP
jgi:hypothetical protein